MLLSPDLRIQTDVELTRIWRSLRGRLLFTESALWVVRVGPSGALGPLFVIGGLPDGPYDLPEGSLGDLLGDFLLGGTAAVLYGRPGAGPWHHGDRAWLSFLRRALPEHPVHVAHDRALVRVEGRLCCMAESLWSYRSSGSILSINSTGSILSIGSAGSIGSIGSIGSFGSVFSIGSFWSAVSVLSGRSVCSVLSWRTRSGVLAAPPGPDCAPAG